nr:hypothetical protein [Tanacetum cinerariifolium]
LIIYDVCISTIWRSGRFMGQRTVVEENTIDEAINVHEEGSDDDLVAVSYPTKQVTRSNATPVKWTKRMIIARSHDSADEIKGETANVAEKDTCADTEAGPSKVRKEIKREKCKKSFDYVENKFDLVAMEIKLKNDSLVLNKEVISEMLRLRNEGINILMNEVLGNEEMIQDWKDQFDVPEKDITPSIIKSKIRRSTMVDFNFKLNIIMLFANIIGCRKKTGSYEFEILKHIIRDTNLCNINWCQYVSNSLPLCKDGWKKDLLNNFFCRPVTLLTLLLDFSSSANLYSSGISFLLAVGTFFTGSGNFFWQWELHNWQ